jgi:CRISPR-associated protein Csb2
MLTLGIRYLTKYAVATNAARQQPEWPPHPGRVFMALAAAHFETGADPDERRVLEWLEAAPAPAICASEADHRTPMRAYVPVNDDHGGVLGRSRQDRAFPRTRPREDCVYLAWQVEPEIGIRPILEQLCAKVTRIGHSSSAVQMWVAGDGGTPEPNWAPGAGNDAVRLRVTAEGTLRFLESAFNGDAIARYEELAQALSQAKGKEKARLKKTIEERFPNGRPESRRPQLTTWQSYFRVTAARASEQVVNGPFDDAFIVLTAVEGPALGLESTLQLTGALRNAAMKATEAKPPEWLGGHTDEGAPSRYPHAAFFPLPYVGYDFADGHVMGLGIAIPRDLRCGDRDEELRKWLGPLFFDPETGDARQIRIWSPRNGPESSRVWDWTLDREVRERPPRSLQRRSWTGPSRRWASVTPLVFHHYPKKRDEDVERIVKEAFVSALLPEPQSIQVSSVSRVEGAGHAMAVPPFTEGGRDLCRYQTHVDVVFPVRVRGPVLAGRGRFRGYGLFRPMAEDEKE